MEQPKIFRYDTVDSTNTVCKSLAAQGVPPRQCLVAEDSLYALQTAAAAGYRTVGIFDANGEADQQGLRNAAEVYLTSLARLPAHWERLNNEN